MNETFRIFDYMSGEEIFPSDDFRFPEHPAINQSLSDPKFDRRFGGPAIIRRIEERPSNGPDDHRTRLYVEARDAKPAPAAAATGKADAGFGGGGVEGTGAMAGSDGGMLTEP